MRSARCSAALAAAGVDGSGDGGGGIAVCRGWCAMAASGWQRPLRWGVRAVAGRRYSVPFNGVPRARPPPRPRRASRC